MLSASRALQIRQAGKVRQTTRIVTSLGKGPQHSAAKTLHTGFAPKRAPPQREPALLDHLNPSSKCLLPTALLGTVQQALRRPATRLPINWRSQPRLILATNPAKNKSLTQNLTKTRPPLAGQLSIWRRQSWGRTRRAEERQGAGSSASSGSGRSRAPRSGAEEGQGDPGKDGETSLTYAVRRTTISISKDCVKHTIQIQGARHVAQLNTVANMRPRRQNVCTTNNFPG